MTVICRVSGARGIIRSRMNTLFRVFPFAAALAGPLFTTAALLAAAPAAYAGGEAAALERSFGRDGVQLVLRAEPGAVSDLDGVEVTLTITHPDTLEVRLPEDFTDRFDGFALEGSYESEPLTAGGTTRREIHLRARPVPGAARLRIAPFPVRWTDPGGGGERWFPTHGVELARRSVLAEGEAAPEGIVENLRPVRVHRSFRDLMRLTRLVALAAAALAALVALALWLRRRVRIARMAPRERALLELEALLARHLPERGEHKRFYVELTHVVRRYIERRHAIRAPRQTTEEFLRAAAESGRFPPETLARLRAFLESADLVKFAGVAATDETARSAVAAARAYLEAEPKEEPTPSGSGDVAKRQGGDRP